MTFKIAIIGAGSVGFTKKLVQDGIDAFVTPMEKLLAGIEEKRGA